MSKSRGVILWIVALIVIAGSGHAQAPATGTSAPPDSAAAKIVAKPPTTISATRASWLSNRPVLRVGDIVTVVLDEQTTASERTTWTASANRGQNATFSATADGKSAVGATGLSTGMQSSQRDQGATNRQGDLSGTVSARIVSISENGVAQIEGKKSVTIDGRQQLMSLAGSIRLEDVAPGNIVHSSRIADATIDYRGKAISPKLGILGKIIGIIWP
jgi:flagellar L-ring protein FlgH